jgi:prevent-host-death family protein
MSEQKKLSVPLPELQVSCTGLLDHVQRSRQVLVVTHHGEPIAAIVPIESKRTNRSWIGSMIGSAIFSSDLLSPASDAGDWDVLRS